MQNGKWLTIPGIQWYIFVFVCTCTYSGSMLHCSIHVASTMKCHCGRCWFFVQFRNWYYICADSQFFLFWPLFVFLFLSLSLIWNYYRDNSRWIWELVTLDAVSDLAIDIVSAINKSKLWIEFQCIADISSNALCNSSLCVSVWAYDLGFIFFALSQCYRIISLLRI